MTPAQQAQLAQAKLFNEWLADSLKNNQIQLAEARDELAQVKAANARLEQKLKARAS